MAKQLMVEAAPTATTEVPNDFPTDTSRGKTKGRRSPSPPEEERNNDDSTVSTHNESSSLYLVVGSGSSSTTCSPSSGASLNKAYYFPTNHQTNSHDRNHRQLSSNIPSSSSSSSCLFDHKLLYLTAPTSPEPQTPETAMGSFSSNGSPPSFQITSTTSSTSPPSSFTTTGSTPTMTGTTRMAPPPGLTMMLHHHGDGDFDDDHDAKLTPFFPQGSEYFLETNHLLHSGEFGTLTHPEPTLNVPEVDDDDDQFILSELPPGIFHGLDLEQQQQQQTVPELTFDSAHQEQFAVLSVDEQTLVRQYCYDAARTTKGFIRNPQAFYAKVLDRYRRQGSLPVFVLPKTQQQEYDALSQSDQTKAKLFCLDAAKTLSNTGGAIRNPSSYFGRVFKTFLEQQQQHLATENGNNDDIPLKQSHGDKVTNNNTLPPKDTKLYSNAPEFILSKDRQKKFASLSLVHQDSVRKSCLKAAHSLVSSGHSVRHPAAYYSRVFDSLFSSDTLLIHHHDGGGGVKTNHHLNNPDHTPSAKSTDERCTTTNITTTDTTTTTTRVPAFILPPSPRRQFQSLSVSEQENAREFCLQLAATVLAAGSTIRSPAAFYGSAFHRYRQTLRRNSSTSTTAVASGASSSNTTTSADAPFHSNNNTLAPFTLTNNQKKNFDSLSVQEQQLAKQYCLDAATTSMQSGKGIRDPTRFYSWALHCYFEEHNLTKIAATSTLEQANYVDNHNNNNSLIYEDLPEPTLEISTGSNQPTSITTPAADETATQPELFNKIELLTNEITTLQSQTSKIDARRKTAEDSIRKFEMKHGQLLEMLELAEMKYSALLDEKKHLEEMYKLEGENYLKLTATLTSVTEELMEERKAKREIQNRWQEEQDKCRQFEAEIQQLKAELGRISLF